MSVDAACRVVLGYTDEVGLSQTQLFDFNVMHPLLSLTLPIQVQISGSAWLVGMSGSLLISISQDLSALLSANWVVLANICPTRMAGFTACTALSPTRVFSCSITFFAAVCHRWLSVFSVVGRRASVWMSGIVVGREVHC